MPKGNNRQRSPEFHASLISEAAPFAGQHQEQPSAYYQDMPGMRGGRNPSQNDVSRSAGGFASPSSGSGATPGSPRLTGPRPYDAGSQSSPSLYNAHPLNPTYAPAGAPQSRPAYAPSPSPFGDGARLHGTPSPAPSLPAAHQQPYGGERQNSAVNVPDSFTATYPPSGSGTYPPNDLNVSFPAILNQSLDISREQMPPLEDRQLKQLYDLSNAPPPSSRRYQEYQDGRIRHLKEVQLTSGNLVLDSPVPEKVLELGKFRQGDEFTHMRYTAATCDPDAFLEERYTLRPVLYGRQTELFVVLTMYNEDEVLFTRTMTAVMKNISHLCTRARSRTWGPRGWEKVVVCIVSDGRTKIHKRVLNILGIMGAYQEGIMQNSVNGKPVTAHLFEYTAQIAVDANLNIRGPDREMVPTQVLFCLKEKNAKKINSHRWFFNAFARLLNPNVCVLIDVGTKPSGTSLYHLWKAFDRDTQVAGACGEICADTGPACCNIWNPLVATQNFEYKMSNILDKPLESVLGYISVLPGAFSAYRYKALTNTSADKGPLVSYFKGELMHTTESSGLFEANMYLAEDRILCFELVAKKNCNWVLKYVKSAKAVTDVPDTMAELISQRRRWLNGSFFAAFYALVHWHRIYFQSSHNLGRLFLFFLEFLYNTISLLFNWFSLANFYLAFYFLGQASIAAPKKPFGDAATEYIFQATRQIYLLALIVMFVLSLGNRPTGSKWIYGIAMALFAIVMLQMLYSAIFLVVQSLLETNFSEGISVLKDPVFRDIVISLGSTYGLYLLSSLMHAEPWHMFTSFLQYLFLLPSFVNILMVYAFCNIHDVSWGTKGDTSVKSDLGHAKIIKQDGVELAQVDIVHGQADINAEYDKLLISLKQKTSEPTKRKRDAATKLEDYNRNFRTILVLFWMFTNALLVVVLTSSWINLIKQPKGQTSPTNPYLAFVFWSVAALSVVRFIGSTWYLVSRLIFG